MKRIFLILALFLFALPLTLTGTLTGAADSAPLGEACCSIVSINAGTGIVTARDLKTGRTFQFEVDSRSLLRKLKIGQKVWADQQTRKVSVDEGNVCCTIIGKSSLDTADVPTPDSIAPCCGIIGVDSARGVLTARDTTTGRTVQFKPDALDIGSLKVGDAVDADILSGKLKSIKGALRTYLVSEPDSAFPCCQIVSIQPDVQTDGGDVCCPIVTARNIATGKTFQFKGSAAVKESLKVGQAVSLDTTGSWAFVRSAATASGVRGRPATYSYKVGGRTGESASAASSSAYDNNSAPGTAISGAGSANAASTSDTADRLAQCEERSRQLEARTRELEGKVAELENRPGTGDVKSTTGTIEGGYEEVRYDIRVKDSQVRVLANGRVIGTYTQDSRIVDIGGMLRRGATNTITFVFSSANPGNEAVLQVWPGVGHFQTVFNFKPTGGKLQDSFEVPFAGKKQ